DFRLARKQRPIKPNIILEWRVELTVCECRPVSESKQDRHQKNKDAVLAPDTDDSRFARLKHKIVVQLPAYSGEIWGRLSTFNICRSWSRGIICEMCMQT